MFRLYLIAFLKDNIVKDSEVAVTTYRDLQSRYSFSLQVRMLQQFVIVTTSRELQSQFAVSTVLPYRLQCYHKS